MRTDSNIRDWQFQVAYHRDEVCYKQLFLHFYPILHRICMGYTGSVEDSEELVSDLLIKIWQMEKRLNEIDNLKFYLIGALKKICLNYQIQKSRQEKKTKGWQITSANSINNADSLLLETEMSHFIRAAVEALPCQCQIVFRLVREQEFTYKEVSEIMNLSINTVKTHMRLSLKKLSETLLANSSKK